MIVQYLTIHNLEGTFLPVAIIGEVVQIPTCKCEVNMNSYVDDKIRKDTVVACQPLKLSAVVSHTSLET